MTLTPDSTLESDLLERVARLDNAQRRELVQLLIEDEPNVPASRNEYRLYWNGELMRRWNQYRSGRGPSYRVDEIIAALRCQDDVRQR